MQASGEDEPNAPTPDCNESRSPRPQKIASLSETVQNFLSQPGADLRQSNPSSDSQNVLQNHDQFEAQPTKMMEDVPLYSDVEREKQTPLAAAQVTSQVSGDRETEQPVLSQSQGQPRGDSDSYKTAAGPETQPTQLDLKAQIPSAQIHVVPTVCSTAEAREKSALAATPGLAVPAANDHDPVTLLEVDALEARAEGENPSSSQFKLENAKEECETQNVFDSAQLANQQEQSNLASEVIQSVEIEKQDSREQEQQSPKANELHSSGRPPRQCVKNTPNYSHTHKGITSAPPRGVTPFDHEVKEKPEIKEPEPTSAKGQTQAEERKVANPEAKNRVVGKRSYEEISKSYESMFAFDWELKDINNLRHPPDREVTPIVVWFYINMLYFPYNAQDLARVPFEEFARPIFESLARVPDPTAPLPQRQLDQAALIMQDSQVIGPANALSQAAVLATEGEMHDNVEKHESSSQEVVAQNQQPLNTQILEYSEDASLPQLLQKLEIEENFFQFRDMFRERLGKIKNKHNTEDVEMEESQSESAEQGADSFEDHMPENQEERDERLFDMIQSRFEQDLVNLTQHNRDELRSQYGKFTDAYSKADAVAQEIIEGREHGIVRQNFPYNPTKLQEYGLEFLSYVDPFFVADIKQHMEWYLQNQNEVLLNVNYPSKLEKEFLRHIEQWQQEKNDLNYKRILQQLAEGGDDPNCDGPNGLNIQRYNSLSAHKRGLVVQEDAQCAICNNGDYEDEDLIVFCGACNIPVHQRCYGIDKIPDNDWICNNCQMFNMRRGIMVKCILCPKRGGAMKPTSIFRTFEHYMNYHTAAQKKKGLQHQNYFANFEARRQQSSQENPEQPQQSQETEQQQLQIVRQGSSGRAQRLQFFEREDKNHALTQILHREYNFQEALIEKTRVAVETFPQNNVELHFLESESIAEIPEDYTFFLQRNEQRLECNETVPTETLYEWVHLSCAMWIPEPTVTPKTPVRMSKIDVKRFDLQCIICCKKNSGACIQCLHSRCKISFHIECARRANYFLEVERVERERNYRVFCEKHRPLKIVREMEEKDKQTLEEVQKFSKVVEKCMEIQGRTEIKQYKQKRLQPFSKPPAPEPPSKREIIAQQKQQKANQKKQQKQKEMNEREVKREQERVRREQARTDKERQKIQKQEAASKQAAQKKAAVLASRQETQVPKVVPTGKPEVSHTPYPVNVRWSNKDTKILFERIKDKFIALFKLRLNVILVDPMVKIKKKHDLQQKKTEKEQRRNEKKRKDKENKKMLLQIQKGILLSGSQRSGLRSRASLTKEELASQVEAENGVVEDQSEQPQPIANNLSQDHENPDQEQQQEPASQNGQERKEESEQRLNSEMSEGVYSRRPTIEELISPEDDVDPYFKFATPQNVLELDWAITFSKYDFPWYDIKFSKYSPKECFKKYTSMVRDAQTFFKKILGGKDKLKKLIASQIDEPTRVFYGTSAEDPNIQSMPLEQEVAEERGESDAEQFCKCKGEYQSATGYFVMCEEEENCINGGWLHPECTHDLNHLTQEEIMKIDKWFCEDCLDRISKQKSSQKSTVQNTNSTIDLTKFPKAAVFDVSTNVLTGHSDLPKLQQQATVTAPVPVPAPAPAPSETSSQILQSVLLQSQAQKQKPITSSSAGLSSLSNGHQIAAPTLKQAALQQALFMKDAIVEFQKMQPLLPNRDGNKNQGLLPRIVSEPIDVGASLVSSFQQQSKEQVAALTRPTGHLPTYSQLSALELAVHQKVGVVGIDSSQQPTSQQQQMQQQQEPASSKVTLNFNGANFSMNDGNANPTIQPQQPPPHSNE